MRLTAELRYQATADAVFDMITDPVFQERKCVHTGALSYDVDVRADGAAVIVTSRRDLPTDTVPEFVRSFVGTSLTVHQVESWQPLSADGRRAGTVRVEIVGAPVRFTGSLLIDMAAADVTVETVDGVLKASVPLLGSRIERAAEPAIRSAISVEQRTGTAWLAAQI